MFKNKVGRPSNEIIKKRRIIKALALSIVFIAILSLTYTLTNINTKRLKGAPSIYYINLSCDETSACYEAGFRNGNLYQRVIDSYNNETGSNLSYYDVITDEQLQTITDLDASSGYIDDATGIEKLINLVSIHLSNNNLKSVDFSSNVYLEKIYIESNPNLNYVNLDNLINLKGLFLNFSFKIKNMNLSDCINLHEIKNLYYPSIINNNIDIYRRIINYSSHFSFEITIPLYKGEEFDLSNIGITEEMSNNFVYDNNNKITISNNIVTATDTGIVGVDYYQNEDHGRGHVQLGFIVYDKLESDKYIINEDDKSIYVHSDELNEIKNNLITEKILPDALNKKDYNYYVDENKLVMNISFLDDDVEQEIINIDIDLATYDISRIDLSDFDVDDKIINVDEDSFDLEQIKDKSINIDLEYDGNTLIVKDLNGNEVDRYTVKLNKEPTSISTSSSTTNIVTEPRTTLNKFENNAKTYDDIVKYFIIGGISIILIIGMIIYTKKKK